MTARFVRTLLVSALALLALAGCTVRIGSGVEHIERFAVDYRIEASGTVHVAERITYDFAGQSGKHGIDRYLSARFSTGTSDDRVYRYENLSVSSPSGASALFSTSLGNALQVRIGNANAEVGGVQTYLISYDIVGALNAATQTDGSTLDEFYWNVTGNYWTVPITRATVTVTGPADVSKVACYTGSTGSTTACESSASTGTTATAAQGDIPSGSGITVDAGFPAGTFADTAPILEPPLAEGASPVTSGSNDGPNPFWSPVNWGVGLGLAVLIPALYRVFAFLRRRDQEFVGVTPGTIPADAGTAPVGPAPRDETIVVSYAPPVGFPVGAANTVLTKKRKTVDITATLIDLAVRGYIRIEEGEGVSKHTAKDFTIVATPERAAQKKARARARSIEAADLLPHEALLLARLFQGHGTSVKLSTLTNTFAPSMRVITATLDTWIDSRKYFVDKLRRVHPALGGSIVAAIAVFILFNSLHLPFVLIPVGAVVGAVVAIQFSASAARRSATGHALFVQLKGFQDYISTAEADRIRFDETEDIFSRYMPWAIVFGEADRWARVFTELAAQGRFPEKPDWYVGNTNAFSAGYLAGSISSIATIGSAVSTFTDLASSSLTSTPSSSGSSGFSSGGGGGFSGGGGGGGGGGSW